MSERYVKCPFCDSVFATKGALLLTKRELEVLQMLANGEKTKDIADRLFVSVKTIESHRQSIYEKTGTYNAARLALWAVKQGLIDVDQISLESNRSGLQRGA